MGHDFIDYADRFVRLSDWDIWTLRHFFLHVAEEVSPSDLGSDEATVLLLLSFLENWKWLGPGVITGTNLSDFVDDQPDRANVLLSLFKQTADYLRAESHVGRNVEFGEVIPLEYLEEHVNSPDAYYTVEQPTCRFIQVVESLQKLVREP